MIHSIVVVAVPNPENTEVAPAQPKNTKKSARK